MSAAQEIQPDDEQSPTAERPLAGEVIAFTGTLASMTHRQAAELAAEHGGTPVTHVSHKTTILVVGEEGWPLENDGQPARKLQQAEILAGQQLGIRIVNEGDWLRILGLQQGRDDVHRLYTPAMLSRLLNVPVNVIRSWERRGLIHAVKKIYRLPYFDFQEVTGVRRLAELLAADVPVETIAAGLERIQRYLPSGSRPLSQLQLLADNGQLFYRDHRGTVDSRTGQRLLAFDEEVPDDAATDAEGEMPDVIKPIAGFGVDSSAVNEISNWFREGVQLVEEEHLEEAVEAFRLGLMDHPGDPDINFHLADVLYRLQHTEAALERYFCVVEAANDFLEAWTQIGCIYNELGRGERALEAFDIALDIFPDFPDAHLHKAEVLEKLGDRPAACRHWREYLRHDTRGPWADLARQRIELLEGENTAAEFDAVL